MSLSLLGCRDGRAFVRVSGPIGADVLDRAQKLIRAMDDAGVHRFSVDVSGARAPDLCFVRLMHRADTEARRHGGRVDLHGVGPNTVPSWAGLSLCETFAVHTWSRG